MVQILCMLGVLCCDGEIAVCCGVLGGMTGWRPRSLNDLCIVRLHIHIVVFYNTCDTHDPYYASRKTLLFQILSTSLTLGNDFILVASCSKPVGCLAHTCELPDTQALHRMNPKMVLIKTPITTASCRLLLHTPSSLKPQTSAPNGQKKPVM